ncbi:MAG: UbiD family decarboxylase [Chloroflexi bacterium]|nr:UbiD family decarboxylase [Chloroflexota bacterium]
MADDLRGWLAQMDEMGELRVVEGADWNLDIGAISMLNGGKANGPALLFDNIRGYPQGYRILTCAVSASSRIAHLLGLPQGLSDLELVGLLRRRLPKWRADAPKFSPREVQTGPILENVLSGDDVDLFEFPAPNWHEADGGRYIGTGHAVITMDPDGGQVNLGQYRVMLHDKNTVGLFARPGTHGRMHVERWHAQGRVCPVAVSLGHYPLITKIAGTSVDDEYSFIGAIREKPVDVIREEITGLPIPASSEIVLAGWIHPGERRLEGPFGEWLGYYAAEAAPAPVIRVERVYHRNDPVLIGAPPARNPSENTHWRVLMASAILHNWLEESGVPDVRGVWESDAGGRTMIIVSVKQRYAGHAKQVGLLIAGCRHGDSGSNMTKYVIVVDDDIDPTNVQDVMWALCTRTDPAQDIDIVRRTWSSSLDPMIPRPAKGFFNSRAIIDACKPFEWLDRFPKEIAIRPELAAQVRGKWGDGLGL